MQNYKITVAYDGTRYKGWQSQKTTEATIQGKLEGVLEKTVGYPVSVTGAGRTDAGVHAKGQTANFRLQEPLDEAELLEWFYRYLPGDIAVLTVKKASERFHSRFFATGKVYCYRIRTSRIPNVFERGYTYTYTEPLSIEAMREAAGYLTGTRDFTSFCGNRHMKKSAVRSLYEIRLQEEADELKIFYYGNSFLQNMLRIITGTLLEVGAGQRDPKEIPEILAAKKRECAGFMAPACGLALLEVKYN